MGMFTAEGELLAVASWARDGDIAVLCAMHSLKPGEGAASRMLEAVKAAAKAAGARKLRAMLTNDNMALVFYQSTASASPGSISRRSTPIAQWFDNHQDRLPEHPGA